MQGALKEGSVATYQLLQNTTTYQLRLSLTAKGLWVCAEESASIWKLTITQELVEQTVAKASSSRESMSLKEFAGYLVGAVSRSSERWGVGVMTPVELELLRGGAAGRQSGNNKLYLILSDKEKKYHYPFTLPMQDLSERDKLTEAIRTMQAQLQELRVERTDKSSSSFSIIGETGGQAEQFKMENEQMKRRIRIYEESLTQKRGAVEIDIILKEKNNLELQAENKRREENREIARLKSIHQMMEREIGEVRGEVEAITKELLLLEDSVGGSAKLKSHAMKVLKSYENELRTQRKVLQKQIKEIETVKRNVLSSKANERKVMGKIKQIQTEIDQATKKANIKEISNRLHSVGRNSSKGSDSSKEPSVASSSGQPRSTGSKGPNNNLVRDNLLRKNNPPASSQSRNHLLKTSPNIAQPRKASDDQMPPRAINSSHQPPKPGTNPRLFNTQKYRSGSKSENEHSVSAEKRQPSVEDREKQKKAMERLTGVGRAAVPRGPSTENKREGSLNRQPPPRQSNSQTKPTSVAKKDNAKDMLNKMKEIKAHYSNQVTKNTTANRTLATKISELTDKKLP